MRTVTLDYDQIQHAASVGVRRNVEAMRRGLKHSHGMRESDGWRNHAEGACGELAAALALGLRWDATVNTFKMGGDLPGDVGGDVQVRCAAPLASGGAPCLIVRDNDRDDDAFVLVVCRMPQFDVVGWAWGQECKLGRFLKGMGGRVASYFVPQSRLRPLETLPLPNNASGEPRVLQGV